MAVQKPTPWLWWSMAALLLPLMALSMVYAGANRSEHAVVLLLPDSQAAHLPVAQAWLDAAREEGLSLVAMTDDAFMRFGGGRSQIAGVILPDTVHREASDLLIGQLYDYVHAGGRLFVSFDAGVHVPRQKEYVGEESRLSRLVGVRYAMYEHLRDNTFAIERVFAPAAAVPVLALQPGKLDFKHSARPPLGELTTYGYPSLRHAHFRTQALGADPTETLLLSESDNVVLARHTFGEGEVLFANLALGYLKTRTDAYLLHRLLNHFLVDMVSQPRLASVPEGVGGMVLNLHVDSNSAHRPLLNMEAQGWFKEGPFSLHLTAGPDTHIVGDGLGLNLDHNPVMQAFVERQIASGHEIGNHGGWGHNIFGLQANEGTRFIHEHFLALNHESVSGAIKLAARSYSAPMGNHPYWVTNWLAAHGFKAFYFAGDNGLGPTRPYHDGQPATDRLWAFPISNFCQIATFEELEQPARARSAEDMARFLEQLANYAADARVARLFYFHPPAAEEYQDVLQRLMTQARTLSASRRFRWYKMEALADFMSRREQVRWKVQASDAQGWQLVAKTPGSLRSMTWVFPLDGASRLTPLEGDVSVRQTATQWVVTAHSGKTMVVVFSPSPRISNARSSVKVGP